MMTCVFVGFCCFPLGSDGEAGGSIFQTIRKSRRTATPVENYWTLTENQRWSRTLGNNWTDVFFAMLGYGKSKTAPEEDRTGIERTSTVTTSDRSSHRFPSTKSAAFKTSQTSSGLTWKRRKTGQISRMKPSGALYGP